MEITETLYVTDRRAWRAWLKKHHRTGHEIWLIYPKKVTGKPRIEYNDAVEEALCFGWIDSIIKKLDDDHTVQRFSRRMPGAKYSQANIERIRALVARRLVIRQVAESVQDELNQEFIFPADILTAIRANPTAWKHFQDFSEPYKRIRIAFIEGARKRPEEFRKRLGHFIAMTEKNKMFGFGGIEKHF